MAPTDFKTLVRCFKNRTYVEQIYESMAKLKRRKDGKNLRHILFYLKDILPQNENFLKYFLALCSSVKEIQSDLSIKIIMA